MKMFLKQQQLFWSLTVYLLTVTVLHKSCKILFLYIFHKSSFQTLLQLSGFSIQKVNLSRKEPNSKF